MLTTAQHKRLEALPEDARVVGVDRECPLVEHPSGRVVRVLENGRTTPATAVAVGDLRSRRAMVEGYDDLRDAA